MIMLLANSVGLSLDFVANGLQGLEGYDLRWPYEAFVNYVNAGEHHDS